MCVLLFAQLFHYAITHNTYSSIAKQIPRASTIYIQRLSSFLAYGENIAQMRNFIPSCHVDNIQKRVKKNVEFPRNEI